MPYFDQDNLERLAEVFGTIADKEQDLREAFIVRAYESEAAKEYATHGVGRRLSLLAHCIEQIFTRLPPETDDVPPREVLLDATICIQAFVFNAYGVLDNLAFVWVNEKNITKGNGQPLPNGRVGLTADKHEVRLSFSQDMQAYLQTCNDWLIYLEGFRHSLGHRIPLYIPPRVLDQEQTVLYQELEARQLEALRRRPRDLAEYDRLGVELRAVGSFKPWMKHSFTDPTPPVVFHAQVLADFATVEEICQRVLAELDR
jgi:hypothetical protein